MADKPVIPKTELERRQVQIKELLNTNSYDALLVPLGVYFNYFFGKDSKPSERLIAGIIPVDDEPFVLSPEFEISNIENSTYIDDIVGWKETESPYQILANEIDERGIGKRIGVDPHLWIIEVERIQKSSSMQMEAANELLDKIRSKKSDWEIKQLQAAAKASAEGILNAIPYLEQGMTEIEFMKIAAKELSNLSGSPTSFGLVQFGENSAIPHSMPSNKKLKNDSVVLLDIGTSVNGYQGDITITIPFGNPPGFEDIYEIVYEANRKALNADKEGIIAADLDNIAREHITNNEYGKYFTHRLGHGLGLEVHEHPYIVGSNQNPLEAGNTHTIEPGIYLPGKFGVRIEDDVVVGKNKTTLLYETPRHNF